MARGDHHRIVAALVGIAALILLAQGAAAQSGSCSASQPCPDTTNCCSQYNYCGTGSAYCGSGCQNGPCTGGTTPAPPAGGTPPAPSGGGSGWSSFLTKAVFEGYFPNRVPFYTYEAFQTAAGTYPAFGTSGSSDDQKRELAAFLANVNQESGGLQYVEEIDKSGDYCDESNTQYPCAAGKAYYGRGPLQLSWNYNYGQCGAALSKDLLANPDQVAQDSATSWMTALWFWMTSKCHSSILANSFSGTINAINGGLECNQAAGSSGNNEMKNRVTYYKSLCQTLGVDPGTDLEC